MVEPMEKSARLSELRPKVKLMVKNPESERECAFASGIAELCLGVRESGSLNAAAKRMHMSYTKAWTTIRETEASLGFQLLKRRGPHGSELTETGNKLLDTYLELEARLNQMAETLYEDIC